MPVTPYLKRLKETACKEEMLEIYEEIKLQATALNFSTHALKTKCLLMLYNCIETYITEFDSKGDNYHNAKILDTFFILDQL